MKEFCKLLFWWNVLLTLALTGLAIAYITHDNKKPQEVVSFKPTDNPSVLEIEIEEVTPDDKGIYIWH